MPGEGRVAPRDVCLGHMEWRRPKAVQVANSLWIRPWSVPERAACRTGTVTGRCLPAAGVLGEHGIRPTVAIEP